MPMRRGVAATLAGLVVLAILLALQAVPGAVDATRLQAPAPRPGDHAVYTVETTGAEPAGRVDVLAGDPFVARDAEGEPRAVLPFHVDVGTDGTPGVVWTEAAGGSALARAADATMSEASWMVNRYVGVNLATSDGANEVTVVTQDLVYGAPRPAGALCGLRHEAQGARVALDARLAVPDCGTALRFGDVERVGGVQAYRFRGEVAGERIDLWLHPDIPYPLQVRLAGAATTTYRLDGFTPGPAPLQVPPAAGDSSAPTVAMAAPTRFGPSIAGVQHPFPIEAAIQAVLENAVDVPTRATEREFAAWWAAHPGAFVHQAAYTETTDGEYVLRGWDLLVGDDAAGARLDVVIEASEDGAGNVLPWSISSPWRNNLQVGFEQGLPPAPAPLPAEAPSVAAAMAAWERQRTPDFATDAATGWGFRLVCGDGASSCPAGAFEVDAGHIRFVTPADPVAEAPGVLAYNEAVDADAQVLRLDASGRAIGLRSVHRSEVADTGGLVALPDLDPSPAGPRDGSLGGAAPSPLELGATVAVAGAVALAVLLWPTLKAIGAGLFSRIQGPRVLEHPGRAAIVDAIQADPGLHFSELARRTGHAAGALRHHLAKLQAAGLVVARPLGGYLCYFAPGTSRDTAALANAATRSEGARKVLEAQQAGIVGVRAIAAHTGLSPSTVSHHLARLRQGAEDQAATPSD